MAYFPFFMELEKKNVVVIGGGEVAYRKVKILAEYGAELTVIAENCCEELMQYLNTGNLLIVKARLNYKNNEEMGQADTAEESVKEQLPPLEQQLEQYMNHAQIAIITTNNSELNHVIANWCHEKGILINVADQMEDCDFIFPALVHREDFTIGITTGGKSPLLASKVRKKLEKEYPPEYGRLTRWMGSIRELIKPLDMPEKEKTLLYDAMLDWMSSQEMEKLTKDKVRKQLEELGLSIE